MSAATQQRAIDVSGSKIEGIKGLAKIVRATKYERGWIMVGHDDRQMAYTTNGYNNATAVTGGGPLAVAGADANGGFRVIAKQPNVKFQVVDATAGKPTVVTITESTIYKIVVLTADVAAVTAVAGMNAVLASAEANKLVDLTFSGTGAGLVAVAAAALAPHVRILGLSAGNMDATDTAGSDPALDIYSNNAQILQGVFGLVADGTTPPVAGQTCWVSDNQTVTGDWAPLLLPVFCERVHGSVAYCHLPTR